MVNSNIQICFLLWFRSLSINIQIHNKWSFYIFLYKKNIYIYICDLYFFGKKNINHLFIYFFDKKYKWFIFFLSKNHVDCRGEVYCGDWFSTIRNNLCWKYWSSTALISLSRRKLCLPVLETLSIYTPMNDTWLVITPSSNDKYWSRLVSLIKTKCSTCNQAF